MAEGMLAWVPTKNHDIRSSFFFFFLSFYFLARPYGIWELSALTRDQTLGPLHWKREVLTTGPPGKSPLPLFFLNFKIQENLRSEILRCKNWKDL